GLWGVPHKFMACSELHKTTSHPPTTKPPLHPCDLSNSSDCESLIRVIHRLVGYADVHHPIFAPESHFRLDEVQGLEPLDRVPDLMPREPRFGRPIVEGVGDIVLAVVQLDPDVGLALPV